MTKIYVILKIRFNQTTVTSIRITIVQRETTILLHNKKEKYSCYRLCNNYNFIFRVGMERAKHNLITKQTLINFAFYSGRSCLRRK